MIPRPFSCEPLGELLQRYAPMVQAICAEQLGCRNCDDVQQEAFLRVLRTCEQVRDRRALPGYLKTITRNLCADRLRSRRKQRRLLQADDELLAALPQPEDPDHELLRERLATLQARIDALPESLRRVLELFYFSQLDYETIAAQTGLTVGAVGQRLCRARRRLRHAVAG